VGEVGFFFSQRHVKSARTRGTSHATLFAIKKARPAATRSKYDARLGCSAGFAPTLTPRYFLDPRCRPAHVGVLAEWIRARVGLGADSFGKAVVSVDVPALDNYTHTLQCLSNRDHACMEHACRNPPGVRGAPVDAAFTQARAAARQAQYAALAKLYPEEEEVVTGNILAGWQGRGGATDFVGVLDKARARSFVSTIVENEL